MFKYLIELKEKYDMTINGNSQVLYLV